MMSSSRLHAFAGYRKRSRSEFSTRVCNPKKKIKKPSTAGAAKLLKSVCRYQYDYKASAHGF
jgi:hypothetical protein